MDNFQDQALLSDRSLMRDAEALAYVESYRGANRFINSLKGRPTLSKRQRAIVFKIRAEQQDPIYGRRHAPARARRFG